MIIFWLKVVLVPLLLIIQSDLYWCLTTWREVNQNCWEKLLQKPQRKRKQSKMVVLLEDVSSKVYLLWCNMQTHYVTWRHLCLPVLSDTLRFQSRTDVHVSGLKLKRWSTVAFSGCLCCVEVSDASLWLIRQPAANLLVNSSTLRLLSPSTIPSSVGAATASPYGAEGPQPLLTLIRFYVRLCVCWRGISSPGSNGFFKLPKRGEGFFFFPPPRQPNVTYKSLL